MTDKTSTSDLEGLQAWHSGDEPFHSVHPALSELEKLRAENAHLKAQLNIINRLSYQALEDTSDDRR